jgi:hypothetical protein
MTTLDEMEALAKAAREGPWMQNDPAPYWNQVYRVPDDITAQGLVALCIEPDDAAFIAACREWVPKAVATLRKVATLVHHVEKLSPLYADLTQEPDGALEHWLLIGALLPESRDALDAVEGEA